MSDKKMIIKNCPSCTKQDVCIAMYLRTSVDCKERTDCVLKRIIENCKHTLTRGYDPLATSILMGLDIQEVE